MPRGDARAPGPSVGAGVDLIAKVAAELAPRRCPSCGRRMLGETREVKAGQAAIAWRCVSCPSS